MNITLKEGFDFFNFPAGEVHAKHNNPIFINRPIYIKKTGSLSDYIFQVLLAADIHKRRHSETHVFFPYLPYSRQDRLTSKDEPFSLKVLADILNSQGYDNIYSFDVHSDVAQALIPNLVNIGLEFIFSVLMPKDIIKEIKTKTLVVPDQGAYKRLLPIQKHFSDTVIAIKNRNTDDGKLEMKGIMGDVQGKDCFIVDDICDGGGTFILLANELYKHGAQSVSLYVTHGVFSKGYEPLINAGIQQIITTNSYRDDIPRATIEQMDTTKKCQMTVIECEEVLKYYV